MKFYKVCFEVPFVSDELFLFLEKHTSQGWEEGKDNNLIVIKIYFSDLKYAESFKKDLLLNFNIQSQIFRTNSLDWSKTWKKHFNPLTVSNELLVIPPWENKNFKQTHLKKILIYPQMAFGTGHHPTTLMCLENIIFLIKNFKVPKNSLFLDIGTGSGILSFACCLFGLRGIGIDIDEKAIKNAKLNKKLNRIKNKVVFILGDVGCIKGKFHLILANIQTNYHLLHVKEITKLLDRDGWLVLSGMVMDQKNKVIEVYKRSGLKGPVEFSKEGWVNLLWHKDGQDGSGETAYKIL